MQDSPKVAKRRQREKKTISQMIALYCAKNHNESARNAQSFCGEAICAECAALDEYAALKTERCPKMHAKTSCDECEVHCYQPQMRERIRQVMRFSGPRMLTKHPIAAIRHLLSK